MFGAAVRTALFAALAPAAGLRVIQRIEQGLGGGKAVAARAHIAHRAAMAEMFRGMKANRKG